MRPGAVLVGVAALSLAVSDTPAAAAGVADVSISIDAPASVLADSNLTYTLTVSNAGPDTADGVVVDDLMPHHVELVRAATTAGFTRGPALHEIQWSISPIPALESVQIMLTVKPVGPEPATDTSAVTTTNSDPTTPDNASATSEVDPQPDTVYMAVTRSGFSAYSGTGYTIVVPLGDAIQWNFFGPSIHSVVSCSSTDTLCTGDLGLFDSGPEHPVSYYREQITWSAEVTLMDAYSSNLGKLATAPTVDPSSGTSADRFTIRDATAPLPTGFEEGIQILTPTSSKFRMWEKTSAQSVTFDATDPAWVGPGTYDFRTKLFNTAAGTHSKAGPKVPVTVTS